MHPQPVPSHTAAVQPVTPPRVLDVHAHMAVPEVDRLLEGLPGLEESRATFIRRTGSFSGSSAERSITLT